MYQWHVKWFSGRVWHFITVRGFSAEQLAGSTNFVCRQLSSSSSSFITKLDHERTTDNLHREVKVSSHTTHQISHLRAKYLIQLKRCLYQAPTTVGHRSYRSLLPAAACCVFDAANNFLSSRNERMTTVSTLHSAGAQIRAHLEQGEEREATKLECLIDCLIISIELGWWSRRRKKSASKLRCILSQRQLRWFVLDAPWTQLHGRGR